MRIGPLFCSLKRAHSSMNMPACTPFNEQKKRTEPPEHYRMICSGITKCTSEKGLFLNASFIVSNLSLKYNKPSPIQFLSFKILKFDFREVHFSPYKVTFLPLFSEIGRKRIKPAGMKRKTNCVKKSLLSRVVPRKSYVPFQDNKAAKCDINGTASRNG